MPGTASTRNTERGLPRPRPSFTKDSNSSTPVLMRLPAVETPSVAALNTSSAGPLALPPDAPAAATPPVVAPPLPTAAAVAKSPGLPSGESVPLPAVEPPAERHTTAAATASPLAGGDPRRSWWEHWSSGIVLILLIIALVTASIIALNDSGKSVSEQLAQEDGHTLGSDFDLSNIHIPEIAAPANLTPTSPAAPSAPPVPALQASSAAQPSAEFSNAPLSAAGGSATVAATAPPLAAGSPSPGSLAGSHSNPQPQAEAAPAATAVPNPQLNSAPAGHSPAAIGTAAPADNGLILGELEMSPSLGTPGPSMAGSTDPLADPTSSPKAEAADGTQPATQPLATLELPVGQPRSSLFPQPEDSPTSAAAPNVPALTASGPAATPAPTPGASPSFYDGAAAQPGHEATAGSSAVPARGQPVDTHLPSLSAMLSGAAAATPQFSMASHAQASPATAAPANESESPASGTQGLLPAAGSAASGWQGAPANPGESVVPSATPEDNSADLIQSYLRFDALNKAQNSQVPSNRFPPASPAVGVPAAGAPR